MEIIEIKGKDFGLYLGRNTILERIEQVAGLISRDMNGRDPLFLCVLNGAFMFASDLMKKITIPSQVSFIKLASYQGMRRGERVHEVFGLSESIEGRSVIVIEDVVDSGQTMRQLLDSLHTYNPLEIRIATLLFKPAAMVCDIHPDYVAFEIPNDFVVGYGMDYDGYGRTLDQVYSVIN